MSKELRREVRVQLDDGLLVIRALHPEVNEVARRKGREPAAMLSLTGPRGRAIFDSVLRSTTLRALGDGLLELADDLTEVERQS
jgi:hypothetical protein